MIAEAGKREAVSSQKNYEATWPTRGTCAEYCFTKQFLWADSSCMLDGVEHVATHWVICKFTPTGTAHRIVVHMYTSSHTRIKEGQEAAQDFF
jgi:hypothetical protein